MKVLIADDEMKVCKLIQHLVDWDALEMEIVGIVNDGETALSAIDEKKPDIVITDIRMPVYDGLELVRRGKEINPDINFIVISGYSQFEYAQQAIKYGVKDYLLKPLKKRELETALSEIRESYESLLLKHRKQEEIQIIINASREQIKENLLIKILHEPLKASLLESMTLDEINKKYECRFTEGFFTGIRVRVFYAMDLKDEEAKTFVINKIHHIIKEKLMGLDMEFISTIYKDEIVILLNTAKRDFSEIEKIFKSIRIELLNFKEEFHEVNFIAGIGQKYTKPADIARSLEEARSAVMNRMGEKEHYYIIFTPKCESGKTTKEIFDRTLRHEIINCQERMDIIGIQRQINNLKERLEQYRYDGKLVYECFQELVQTLQFGAKNCRNQLGGIFEEEYEKFYWAILDFEKLFQWIVRDVEYQYSIYKKNLKEAESKPIRDAKKYIYDNYNAHISLESVSEYVGFNAAYFSTLFKKETGKNFLEYLTDLRIENAKNYLIQTDYDLMEIASAVGYSDLKYFSKLFKKIT